MRPSANPNRRRPSNMKRKTNNFNPSLLDEYKKNAEALVTKPEEPEEEEDPEEAERKRKEANLKKLGLGPGGPMGIPMMGMPAMSMSDLRGRYELCKRFYDGQYQLTIPFPFL